MEVTTDVGIGGDEGDTTNFYISFHDTESVNMYISDITTKQVIKWLSKFKVKEYEIVESSIIDEYEIMVCIDRPFKDYQHLSG